MQLLRSRNVYATFIKILNVHTHQYLCIYDINYCCHTLRQKAKSATIWNQLHNHSIQPLVLVNYPSLGPKTQPSSQARKLTLMCPRCQHDVKK